MYPVVVAFLILSVSMIIIGWILRRKHKRLKLACTEQTIGIVAKADYSLVTHGYRGSTRCDKVRLFVRYQADGIEFRQKTSFDVESSVRDESLEYAPGCLVDVRYDPSNPNRSYVIVEGEHSYEEFLGPLLIFVGLFILTIMAIFYGLSAL